MTSKPKLNQPDVETTTTFSATGESLTINMTIPTKQFKDIFVTGTSVINQQSNPTISECIKEWENRGWTYSKSNHFNWLIVEKDYKKIIFDGDEINYSCAKEFDIDLDLHNLIHKTLKALEEKKDE